MKPVTDKRESFGSFYGSATSAAVSDAFNSGETVIDARSDNPEDFRIVFNCGNCGQYASFNATTLRLYLAELRKATRQVLKARTKGQETK